jgi:DNA mismatch repair protein MutH
LLGLARRHRAIIASREERGYSTWMQLELTAPRSEAELLARAEALAGKSFADVAASMHMEVPADLRHHKGWVGNMVERALGASAASRDEPDFVGLGIELKTVPVDPKGHALESTFVCTVPLRELGETGWAESRVRRKLARVLWVPVEGMRDKPLAARRIGAAFLWSPTVEQEDALRFDWEELAGAIGRGDIEALTGHLGRHLQVRPKAAHGGVRARSIDAEGHTIETLPRGFYLRPRFTESILREAFGL